MRKWFGNFQNRRTKKNNNRQRLWGYISGILILYQDIILDTFKSLLKLQGQLKDFQINSCSEFIYENSDDNVCCPICILPLLGPCVQFACDCKLKLHEGCMFRLILGGFTECPQCRLELSLYKYRPKMKYPKTLDMNLIHKHLSDIIEDEDDEKNINIDRLIQNININNINNTELLSTLYTS